VAQSRGDIPCRSSGRYGYRDDIGKTFRSTFEANFARYCRFKGIEYEYETRSFETELGIYTPDFYLIKTGEYYELRGYRGRCEKKAKLSSKIHGIRIVFIYQDEFYEKIKDDIGKIVGWEDGTVPILENFDPNIYESKICRCGKTFIHRKSKKNIGSFCSNRCVARFKNYDCLKGIKKGIRKNREWKCEICGIKFVRKEVKDKDHRFCSKRCYWDGMKGKESNAFKNKKVLL
jgi:endogenous inhibitor of DNA gyrase (YacG/DUF329 family)